MSVSMDKFICIKISMIMSINVSMNTSISMSVNMRLSKYMNINPIVIMSRFMMHRVYNMFRGHSTEYIIYYIPPLWAD